jgi:hypothetical protein
MLIFSQSNALNVVHIMGLANQRDAVIERRSILTRRRFGITGITKGKCTQIAPYSTLKISVRSSSVCVLFHRCTLALDAEPTRRRRTDIREAVPIDTARELAEPPAAARARHENLTLTTPGSQRSFSIKSTPTRRPHSWPIPSLCRIDPWSRTTSVFWIQRVSTWTGSLDAGILLINADVNEAIEVRTWSCRVWECSKHDDDDDVVRSSEYSPNQSDVC